MLFRMVIDLTMTILMLVAMAYQITGNTIHELVGVVLLILFVVHNILNRRWYKTIIKGKYNVRRILSIAVNLLFLVSMAVVIISSVPISSDVFPYIPVENDMILRQIHVQTSYWGFIFMAVHIGISWGTIINAVRKMTGITSTSRIRTIANGFLSGKYTTETKYEEGELRNLMGRFKSEVVDHNQALFKLIAEFAESKK